MHDYCDRCHEEIVEGSTYIRRTEPKGIFHQRCHLLINSLQAAGKKVHIKQDQRNVWL